MKIRFIKNWCGEEYKKRLDETWDVSYSSWSEIKVEQVDVFPNKVANLIKEDGNIVLDVPVESFETV